MVKSQISTYYLSSEQWALTRTVLSKRPIQSTPRNHLCRLTSSGPPYHCESVHPSHSTGILLFTFKFPKRLLRSPTRRRFKRSFAKGSKWAGNWTRPARIFSYIPNELSSKNGGYLFNFRLIWIRVTRIIPCNALPCKHFKDQDTQSPPINSFPMTFTLDNFRGQVFRRAA